MKNHAPSARHGVRPADGVYLSDAPGRSPRRGVSATMTGLVRATRPRQWIKNLLVFAVPLASGTVLEPHVLVATMVALISFTMASAAVYLVNDTVDIDNDRIHPEKRHRPIASGVVPVPLALGFAGALGLAAMVVPIALGYLNLAVIIVGYLVLQVLYQAWGKHQTVFDLAFVASGFVLRGVAGGAAAGITPSPWFLVVTVSVAMFVVSGKRYSELQSLNGSETRRVLGGYSPGYLRFVWSVSVAIALTFYILWSVELAGSGNAWAAQLSAVPFSLALLRYAQDVDSGKAQAPEDVLLKDRGLLILGSLWVLLFLAKNFLPS